MKKSPWRSYIGNEPDLNSLFFEPAQNYWSIILLLTFHLVFNIFFSALINDGNVNHMDNFILNNVLYISNIIPLLLWCLLNTVKFNLCSWKEVFAGIWFIHLLSFINIQLLLSDYKIYCFSSLIIIPLVFYSIRIRIRF